MGVGDTLTDIEDLHHVYICCVFLEFDFLVAAVS